MKLVIGGAFQGKLNFAKKMTGKETGWADGAAVSKEELSACSGVYDFQELVRRWLLLEEETGTAPEAELEDCCRKIQKSALLRMNSVTEWFRLNPSTGNGGKRRGASVRSWQQRLIR